MLSRTRVQGHNQGLPYVLAVDRTWSNEAGREHISTSHQATNRSCMCGVGTTAAGIANFSRHGDVPRTLVVPQEPHPLSTGFASRFHKQEEQEEEGIRNA